MADSLTIALNVLTLLGTASFMIVIAYMASNFLHKPKIAKYKYLTPIALGVTLGLLAIYGTLTGIKLENGTIINVRELAAMIAGVTGGPIGGVIAGLIGGIHRYTVGGATALPCTISTIGIGLVSGLVSLKMFGKLYLLKGAVLGIACEAAAMGLILVLVSPFETALMIVEWITIPMIAANALGLMLWLYVFNNWKKT
jgi:sigma-B regulation protein RsbU (phosphoserine phosphatase)